MKEKRNESKIRIIIGHEDKKVCKIMADALGKLEYVEIVGIAESGIDTYHKIVELEPEMIFIQYYFADLGKLELIKKIAKKMKDNLPVFNVIVNEIPHEELKQMLDITDDKIDGLVREPYNERVVETIQVYMEHRWG